MHKMEARPEWSTKAPCKIATLEAVKQVTAKDRDTVKGAVPSLPPCHGLDVL